MGYPSLWLEIGTSRYVRQEAQVLGRGIQESREQILTLCGTYIEEFGVPNYPPFLADEPDLTPLLKGYETQLSVVKEFLRQEVYFVDEEHLSNEGHMSPSDEKSLLERVLEQDSPQDAE